jgi:hypothetical protein
MGKKKIKQEVLSDFSATIDAKPDLTPDEIFAKFPEFGNDEGMLQSAVDYHATSKSGKYKTLDELNAKFPEFEIEKKNPVGKVSQPIAEDIGVTVSLSPSELNEGQKVQSPIDPDIDKLFKEYPNLKSFSNPEEYLVQNASGKMQDILKKNNFGLEFQDKGNEDYIVGDDTLKLDNVNKRRIYLNPEKIGAEQRYNAIKLDVLSHAMHNNKDYQDFSADLKQKLYGKYGKKMVDGNDGVDGYIRGYLSDSPEYEPYKKELEFLPEGYFEKLDKILKGEKKGSITVDERVLKLDPNSDKYELAKKSLQTDAAPLGQSQNENREDFKRQVDEYEGFANKVVGYYNPEKRGYDYNDPNYKQKEGDIVANTKKATDGKSDFMQFKDGKWVPVAPPSIAIGEANANVVGFGKGTGDEYKGMSNWDSDYKDPDYPELSEYIYNNHREEGGKILKPFLNSHPEVAEALKEEYTNTPSKDLTPEGSKRLLSDAVVKAYKMDKPDYDVASHPETNREELIVSMNILNDKGIQRTMMKLDDRQSEIKSKIDALNEAAKNEANPAKKQEYANKANELASQFQNELEQNKSVVDTYNQAAEFLSQPEQSWVKQHLEDEQRGAAILSGLHQFFPKSAKAEKEQIDSEAYGKDGTALYLLKKFSGAAIGALNNLGSVTGKVLERPFMSESERNRMQRLEAEGRKDLSDTFYTNESGRGELTKVAGGLSELAGLMSSKAISQEVEALSIFSDVYEHSLDQAHAEGLEGAAAQINAGLHGMIMTTLMRIIPNFSKAAGNFKIGAATIEKLMQGATTKEGISLLRKDIGNFIAENAGKNLKGGLKTQAEFAAISAASSFVNNVTNQLTGSELNDEMHLAESAKTALAITAINTLVGIGKGAMLLKNIKKPAIRTAYFNAAMNGDFNIALKALDNLVETHKGTADEADFRQFASDMKEDIMSAIDVPKRPDFTPAQNTASAKVYVELKNLMGQKEGMAKSPNPIYEKVLDKQISEKEKELADIAQNPEEAQKQVDADMAQFEAPKLPSDIIARGLETENTKTNDSTQAKEISQDIAKEKAVEIPEPISEGGDTAKKANGTSELVKKTDADIEGRMNELEEKGFKSGSEEAKEFSTLEKEMEKRERDLVFKAPLDKVVESVDALLQKEKDKPNGFGSFIEKRDARETKEVAEKYMDAKSLSDEQVKQDFKDALFGNPDTWYADGLKLRESLNEATRRGIDTQEIIGEIQKEFVKDGYTEKEATQVIARRLKPILEGAEEVNQKQIENEKPIETELPKSEKDGGTEKESVAEISKGTGEAEGGKEPIAGGGAKGPPIEPTVGEGSVHSEDPSIEFKKSEFRRARNRVGIDDFVDDGKTTHLEESTKAQKTIDKWREDGTYSEKMGDIQERASKGQISNQEKFIFAKHIADLDATVNGMKNKNSPEFDKALTEYNNALDAADKARSEAGRQLGMIPRNKGTATTLSDVMVDMMGDSGVDKLTKEQKAEAEVRFEKVEQARADAEAKLAERDAELKKVREDLVYAEAKLEAQRQKAGRSKPKTKEEFTTERDNIKKNIKDKWKGAGNDNTLSVSVPYAKQLIAIAPEVGKLIRSYIEEGVTTLDAVRKRLKTDLEEAEITVTDEDVRALIAREYDSKKQTRNEISEKIFELREEEKILRAIEELETGGKSKKPIEQIEKNKRLKALKERYTKLKREKITDDEKFISAANSKIKANEKRLQELEEKIRKGDFAPDPEKRRILEDKELKNRNKKVYEDAIEAENKRFEAELQYERDRVADQMKNWNWKQKGLNILDVAIATSKSSVAMVDQSAVLVQSLLFSLAHPARAAVYAARSFRDIVNSKRYNRAMNSLHSGQLGEDAVKSGLAIFEPRSPKSELRNELMGGEKSLWNKNIGIPEINLKGKNIIKGRTLKLGVDINVPQINILGKEIIHGGKISKETEFSIGKAFERSVSTYLNNARLFLFEQQTANLKKQKKTFENSPEEYKNAARVANELTGHGKVHAALTQATGEGLNRIIWSPKMFSSSLNILGLGDLANIGKKDGGFYKTLNNEQRKFVGAEIGRFLATSAVLMGLAKLNGGDYDLDPRSSGFGSIKLGDWSWNIFGRYGSVVRTLVQSMWKAKFGEDIVSLPVTKRIGTFWGGFIRGKMTPLSGALHDIPFGQNYYSDEKITPMRFAKNLLLPMASNDIPDFIKQDPNIKGAVAAILTMYGASIRNQKVYEERKAVVDAEKAVDAPPKKPSKSRNRNRSRGRSRSRN